MDYAIIRVGGKQHRVRDGETLVVDRVRADVGGTFEPDVLLGDGGVKVVVKVLAHERGPKIRIGKYRKRTGYKRHNGFRAATSRIEITIGAARSAPRRPAKAAPSRPRRRGRGAEAEAARSRPRRRGEAVARGMRPRRPRAEAVPGCRRATPR